ncbi:YDG domain-containing protein [Janthinobacterium sp. AD80]|uniref:YDG domain-containing protein n=1 Tax=Janthinobacterium sp. AD80 TaxID=1528773 RepID=UPI0011AFBE28|nr:YDG domain-containing protein [Janthinobacterium sp. AD80]
MHNRVHYASVSAQMLPPCGPPMRRTALALLLASCFGAAQANPALPQVVNGQATFNQQGNIFSITNTPNTIINWQSFSIHAGEITRFIQQNGNSAVLNRITGQDPSKILGSLESNGKVFLINPNGIVFGQGAKVDVNGLVASSLGLSNEDFLSGKRAFTAGATAGGVSNAGVINGGKGGQVLLIAPNVENTGIITAPNGEVILAAGRSVQLADPGNPQLRVLVSAPADQALNLGQIIAQGGSIGMAGALVSQRGVLNANSAVVGENGKIVLKASGQTVLSAGSMTSATGAGKGGEIQVLGEQVGLFGNARVDASGGTGGGTVLLGGDYQGKNAAVQNARQLVVNKDASIAADAIGSGNGGKVIAWGTESAQVHGSISARGGAQGGDGGFVETSGRYLAVDAIRVDTSARAGRGKRGNWLLDPYDIDVVQGAGGSLGDVDQFAEGPPATSTSIGADVISNASSNVTLQALHRINFSSAVNMVNAGVGLSATAGETINVYAAISTNGGNVNLSANDASSGAALGLGSNINLAAPVSTHGGNISLSGASITGAGVLNSGNGNLSLRANLAAGDIHLTGSGSQLVASGVGGQSITLQADSITLAGGIQAGGTAGGANVTIKPLSSARAIDLGSKSGTALGLSTAELAGISAASLTIGDGTNTGGILISDALTTAGDLRFNSASAITATAAVSVGGQFALDGGAWTQNAPALAAFSARGFSIAPGASFLRVTGGDGGAATPYLIADIYGLQGIGSLGLGNSYRLGGNIDASGTLNWNQGAGFVPIASSDGAGYAGLFDGAGFSINGLYINASNASVTSGVGLFGKLQGGTVQNLGLQNGRVTGSNNVGAVAGISLGGTLENVHSGTAVVGANTAGGLVGSNGGSVRNASASGDVAGVNADNAGNIGGLAGMNQAGASITASYATGSVTGARANIGGLVGHNAGAVTQSYAAGAVSGAANIGGLVGRNAGSIENAYATGAVAASGSSDPQVAHENLGGLIGWSEAGSTASHVYSSGAVAGNGFAGGTVGGLVGRADAGAGVAYGFWNYETAGTMLDRGGARGLTTAEMRQQGSFNDYNFNSVWRIYDGYTTPMLKAFLKPLQVTVTADASKVYDGQLASFLGSLSYSGLLDGDTGANGSLGYGNARNVGSYGLTGLWSTKYDISLGGSTTLAITPRTLTVSIGGSKVYDGHLGFGGAIFTLGNVVNGDSVSAQGTAVFADKNAGSGKVVNASGISLSGNDLGNYSIAADASGVADISRAVLNAGGFSAASKVYDGNTSASLSVLFEGLVGNDQVALSGALASFGDKNAGKGKNVNYSYDSSNLQGADAGNYVLASGSGSTTADITPRALNVQFNGINKTYDGTTGAALNFGDDRVAGDRLDVSALASFGDKNAGAGKTVFVTNMGLGGADAGNYVLASGSGSTTADITPRALNVQFNGINKTYDGTTGAALNFGDDRVAGDRLDVSALASFGDKNAGAGKTVFVTNMGLGGADAGNYVLTSAGGTTQATIAQKQLSTWVGSGNGLWSDAANWDGGVVPEGANVLAVDFSRSNGIVTYSAAAGSTILKNLNSASGLRLTGGSLTVGDGVQDRSLLASLEISGGNFLLNGSLSADRYAQGGGVLSGNGNLLVANSFSQAAGAIRLAGQLAITQAAGDLRFASLAANAVTLTALNGAIGQDGALLAGSLAAQAKNGIVLGHAGNQLGSFSASNSAGGGIVLNNTSAPGTLALGSLATGAGDIAINNTGGIAAGNINANGGNVSLTARSPISVNGKIEGNDIALNASTDVLLGDGAQLAAARDISLAAGRDIGIDGNASVASGGNFAASAQDHVRLGGSASFTVPAAASMSLLAKTGSITGGTGVRIARQRANVSLLAPNGTVSVPDAVFLPATVDKPVIDPATSAAIDNALAIIKQADRANDIMSPVALAETNTGKKDDKDASGAANKPTGSKFDDPSKKMYCN